MRIALIDDGIEPTFCPGLLQEYDLCVLEDGRIVKRSKPILTDHGTTSARIISSYAPDASFCSLQVFSTGNLKTSLKQLLAALEWCYGMQIPIIHLSLGSTLWLDYAALRKATAKLMQNDQILIAAHSNNSLYTMPACFMGVLGTMADGTCSGDEYYVKEHADWNQIQVCASSRHMLSVSGSYVYTTQVTNSYAAPVITAKVHEILSTAQTGTLSVSKVYAKLAGHAVGMFRMQPDFVENAILYKPEGKTLQQELFFFSVQKYVDNLSDLKDAILNCPYAPVIIIPSGIQEDDEEAYRLCMIGCKLGFLYAGTPSRRLGEPGNLFWDEAQYYDSIQCTEGMPKDGFPEETARLVIEGREQSALVSAIRIKQEFERHGHPTIVVSDYTYSYLYGMIYLPNKVEAEHVASVHAALKQVSVVIYCLKRAEHTKTHVNYDFKVIVRGNSIEMSNEQISLPEMATEWELMRLYQYILSYEPHE